MKSEQARPGKRPLRSLTAEEKMSAIQRVHDGESKASVARDIGVPESTLRGWCKSEHKIRGMARNSSTPESEAHSPASSSGANANGSAMSPNGDRNSNEDEGNSAAAPPPPKRSKSEHVEASSDSNDARAEPKVTQLDYLNLINNIGMQKDSAMLLQQLGSMFGNGNVAANILAARNLAALQQNAGVVNPLAHTVGLVENGLQYSARAVPTTSNGCAAAVAANSSTSGRRHSSQVGDGPSPRSGSSRRSHHNSSELSPSSVAPPPRRSMDNGNTMQLLQRQYLQQQQMQQQNQYHRQIMNNIGSSGGNSSGGASRSKRNSSNGYSSNAATTSTTPVTSSATSQDSQQQDQLMLQWLASYGQYMQHHANAVRNLPQNTMFHTWWKMYCANNNIGDEDQAQANDKKSTERVKANLDRLLMNNNSSNERNFNNTENGAERTAEEQQHQHPREQQLQQHVLQQHQDNAESEEKRFREREDARRAIEHGDHFVNWLADCSDPLVSQFQLHQLKTLLLHLRKTRLDEAEQCEDLSNKDN